MLEHPVSGSEVRDKGDIHSKVLANRTKYAINTFGAHTRSHQVIEMAISFKLQIVHLHAPSYIQSTHMTFVTF